MEDRYRIAAQQLGRMRGMTALYHRRFFWDINLTTVLTLGLFVVGWAGIAEAFLLIPVVALIGAAQTAFDASYLIFARTYAGPLEEYLNRAAGDRVLIAAEMESAYLFDLGARKVVTIPLSGPFTWFGFMTAFYTAIGVSAYGFGLALGWHTLDEAPVAIALAYSVVLGVITLATLATGLWWFVGGVGEKRLARIVDTQFGSPIDAHGG